MKTFTVGVSLVSLAAAGKPDYEGMWLTYKTDYNKHYEGNGGEETKRFDIFKANVDIIEEHNAKKLSYWLGLNEFADQTWEEFSSTHLGYDAKATRGSLPRLPFPSNITDVADSIDWVAKGAVTPVKDQKSCGSCWAFSTTGSLEGAGFVASGKLISLSEEELVQCDAGDHGCDGGLMDNAFQWVQTNGLCLEADYPYDSGTGVTGYCKKAQTGCKSRVSINGFTDVPPKNEAALQAAVSKQPVSVAIEADKSAFQLYKGGVLDNAACGTNLDHGILAVGYGTDGDKDYWKIKNSWGVTWGEKGFGRMVRNKNQCGISQQASYPTGAAVLPGPPPGPPPPPTPAPTPSPTHYGSPPCHSDEELLSMTSGGAVCAPHCDSSPCPKDVPAGSFGKPACVLVGTTLPIKRYCGQTCVLKVGGCAKDFVCADINLPLHAGICVYRGFISGQPSLSAIASNATVVAV